MVLGKRSRMENFYRVVKKYGPLIAANLATNYRRQGGSYTTTKRRRKRLGGSGVTSQYDRKVQYVKKTMPYRKKKKWISFKRKVEAVLQKGLGTRTVIRNSQISRTWANDGQEYLNAVLYGADGSADTSVSVGNDDLKQLIANDADANFPTAKIHYASGVIDITMCNKSVNESGSFQMTTLEIDVYEIVLRKRVDASSLNNLLESATYGVYVNTPQINLANPELTLNVRGATPFDFPDFTSRGVKILKKTKYMLQQGEVATYQYRDPKNFVQRKDNINDTDDNFAIPWKTRCFLIVAKGVPTGVPTDVLKSLQIGVTRKYSYKIMNVNDDGDNLLP